MDQNSIFNPVNIIQKKRDGQELTETEIAKFIDGVTKGTIKDYQASAFLMATYLNGMSRKETQLLTFSMLKSGKVLPQDLKKPNIIDKHSTGGIGDKASLILGPIAAAAGVRVPMIAGRGLGHTGGTVDKVESIKGFRTDLNLEEFTHFLNKNNMVLIGQTQDIAPADKKLYALRDVTATVSSIPLITASILSKKLAEGINGLVMDVKFGNGAFMKKKSDAKKLAKSIAETAALSKVKCSAFITNMNWPLGDMVGHALEIQETIETLKGNGPKDLEHLSIEMAAAMIKMAGIKNSISASRKLAKEVLKNGKAFECFRKLVMDQGGDVKMIDNPKLLPSANEKSNILATQNGYIKSMQSKTIGQCCQMLGGGRKVMTDKIDFAVGFEFIKKPGAKVKKGDVVAYIYHHKEQLQIVKEIQNIFSSEIIRYSKTKPKLDPLILDHIERH